MTEGAIHIYAPKTARWELKRRKCPVCLKRANILYEFYEWYGWHVTCLRCGDQWEDGELLSRPFRPGWRKENIARAKERLKRILLEWPE